MLFSLFLNTSQVSTELPILFRLIDDVIEEYRRRESIRIYRQ